MSSSPLVPVVDYHVWRTRATTVAGIACTVATKPGLVAQGRDDAAVLLAEHTVVTEGAVVVSLHSGNGLVGAIAARRGAARVYLSDRSAVAVEASRRTLAANGITTGTVAAGHGTWPFAADLRADVATIRIPTEKLALLQLLTDAFSVLRVGGRCCIAGATNEGIKSAATLLQQLFGNVTVLATQGGCRVVMAVKRSVSAADAAVFERGALPPDRFHPVDVMLRGEPLRLYSRPGVFSGEHLDDATALLAEHMRVRPGESVLDLGCGSGPLGITAARLSGTGRVSLVDVDVEAVRCASRAIDELGLTQCEALPSDVASAVRDERFDVVVANPPFHVGKGTDLDVPTQFILDAHAVLHPGGSLQLVANRTLPYERIVHERFGNVTTVHDGARFKILAARR